DRRNAEPRDRHAQSPGAPRSQGAVFPQGQGMSGTDRPVRLPLTVFYDASCPLCAGEMRALKARDRGDRLALVDCSAPEFEEAELLGDGLRRSDLMRLIHARDAHGRWFVGVDAFEAA